MIVSGGRKQAGEFLAPLPVALLRARPALAELPEALERLGIGTLGELAALVPAALADRFGTAGLHAHELASGGDGALRPRPAREYLREALELPEAASGIQLERALGLLIDRLLARRERRGRTLRAVVLSAVLVEQGGTWREQVVFREALADPVRMRLALAPRLALMPAPAQQLRLAVERFGPHASDQRGLLDDPVAARKARLREAIRQARAAAGPDAALRVLEVDPGIARPRAARGADAVRRMTPSPAACLPRAAFIAPAPDCPAPGCARSVSPDPSAPVRLAPSRAAPGSPARGPASTWIARAPTFTHLSWCFRSVIILAGGDRGSGHPSGSRSRRYAWNSGSTIRQSALATCSTMPARSSSFSTRSRIAGGRRLGTGSPLARARATWSAFL